MSLSAFERRELIEEYARRELSNPHVSKAQAFVDILDYAVHLIDFYDVPHPAKALTDDTFAVLIGDGLLGGRGRGPHYAATGLETQHWGSSGFKPEFQDTGYQVQHAMAGIAIGHQGTGLGPFRPLQVIAKITEELQRNPRDEALYDALFPIGNNLNDANYRNLPKQVAETIGDKTVQHIPSLLRGNDDGNRLLGLGDKDVINAGRGNDTVFGGAGNDIIYGGEGADHLFGEAGNDRIDGGPGADALNGGGGNDTLVAGARDDLYGGPGVDKFLFLAPVADVTILDFHHPTPTDPTRDVIDLSAIQNPNNPYHLSTSLVWKGQAPFDGSPNLPGQVRYWNSDNGHTYVSVDKDGDRASDFSIALKGTYTLVAADFIL